MRQALPQVAAAHKVIQDPTDPAKAAQYIRLNYFSSDATKQVMQVRLVGHRLATGGRMSPNCATIMQRLLLGRGRGGAGHGCILCFIGNPHAGGVLLAQSGCARRFAAFSGTERARVLNDCGAARAEVHQGHTSNDSYSPGSSVCVAKGCTHRTSPALCAGHYRGGDIGSGWLHLGPAEQSRRSVNHSSLSP